MNLAVGRMAAVGAMVAGYCFERLGTGLVTGVLTGLFVATCVGALTGLIIVKSRVNSFIVTLAMDFLLLGVVSLVYSKLTTAAAFTKKPPGMTMFRNGSLGDVCLVGYCGPQFVPLMTLPCVAAVMFVYLLYRRTRMGREMLSIGTSERASEASGIATKLRVVQTHALSGLLAGMAGLMLAFSNGTASAAIGNEFMIPSFLGPLLGGTLLLGGAVSVIGTVIGTLLTFVIRAGLTIQGVGLETLNVSLGAALLLVLSAQGLRLRRRRPADRRAA
jgi:ribose transport system permease protein